MIDIKIEGLHVTSDDRQYTVWEEKVYTAGKSVGETYSIPVAYYTNMDSLLKGVAELLTKRSTATSFNELFETYMKYTEKLRNN